MFLYLLLAFGFWLLAEMKSPRIGWNSGTWKACQIKLVLRSKLLIVRGEVAETEIDEIAFTAGGGMTVHEADVHAAVVVGGTAVVVGFGMARIKRPDRTALGIGETDGVAAEGGFGRGLAAVGAVVAGVVPDVTHDEVAEDTLAEREAGKLVLHVRADDTDGVGGVVVGVFMARAEVGLLVQTAFVDNQNVVALLTSALVGFPVTNPVMSVVIAVDGIGQNDLLEVGEAGDGLRFRTGLRQSGQQHGGQNRDDCDDDQEFNQREVFFHVWFSF